MSETAEWGKVHEWRIAGAFDAAAWTKRLAEGVWIQQDWAVQQLLRGEEVALLVPARVNVWSMEVPPQAERPHVVRVRVAWREPQLDAYVLRYIYNGEYAELTVDASELRQATTTKLLLWADDAFI